MTILLCLGCVFLGVLLGLGGLFGYIWWSFWWD